MKAEQLSFADIMSGVKIYSVPFFQRRYVWDKPNWDDLVDELLSGSKSHFLGSVIFKVISDGLTGPAEGAIIDGQQRLTTLCVLLKACYDVCTKGLTDETKLNYFKEAFGKMSLSVKTGKKLKIQHSMVDEAAFRKVMSGEAVKVMLSDQIDKCYMHFKERLSKNPDEAENIFDILNGGACILVAITLNAEENEQAIFDIINSAGVRLTSADIVKNAIFQRLIDLTHGDKTEISRVKELYKNYWSNVFEADEESVDYWSEEQTQGRFQKTRLEFFLQCVAVIKGIFNPQENSLSELANCYKRHFDRLTSCEARTLIKDISEFADCYRNCFGRVRSGEVYSYSDDCQRLIHILRVCETSTFDPLILKMVKEDDSFEDGALSPATQKQLHMIERYVIRHQICGASTKNFNKECASILDRKKTLSDYLSEKIANGEISDNAVRAGLRQMKSNKLATLILFWIELYNRHHATKASIKKLGYSVTLEHVMPRKWAENWPMRKVPVVYPETGAKVLDLEKAKAIREFAVQEIGNMTLLNGHLNTAISNNSIREKIEGVGKKPGIKKFNDYYCTKDLIEQITASGGYLWNEHTIRARTENLANTFLRLW